MKISHYTVYMYVIQLARCARLVIQMLQKCHAQLVIPVEKSNFFT
jgi:hypothetical protein